MQDETKLHLEEMSQTGAGITQADQINRGVKNDFVTKWGMYQHHSILYLP